MSKRKFTAVSLIAFGLSLAVMSGIAAADGTFKGIVIATYDYETLEHYEAKIVTGPLKGVMTVMEGSREPFATGAVFMRQCVVFASRTGDDTDIEAPCTLTDESGDQVYTRSVRLTGDVATRSAAPGGWQLLGGTGKYANVTGTCPYSTKYLPNGFMILHASCDWERK